MKPRSDLVLLTDVSIETLNPSLWSRMISNSLKHDTLARMYLLGQQAYRATIVRF